MYKVGEYSEYGVYNLAIDQGTENKAVVVIAGIGDMKRECSSFEMRDSCREAYGKSVHRLFVRDTSRSWYQRPDGWAELVSEVESYLLANQVRSLLIIGLSMGGYGALELCRCLTDTVSHRLTFFHVVALSTRTQLLPPPDFDKRNHDLLEAIGNLRSQSPLDAPNLAASYTLLFAVDELEDVLHASHVAQRKGLLLLGIRGEHNIANQLRLRGQLNAFLRDALEAPDTLQRGDYGIFALQPEHFTLAEAYWQGASAAERDLLAQVIPPARRPWYAF